MYIWGWIGKFLPVGSDVREYIFESNVLKVFFWVLSTFAIFPREIEFIWIWIDAIKWKFEIKFDVFFLQVKIAQGRFHTFTSIPKSESHRNSPKKTMKSFTCSWLMAHVIRKQKQKHGHLNNFLSYMCVYYFFQIKSRWLNRSRVKKNIAST